MTKSLCSAAMFVAALISGSIHPALAADSFRFVDGDRVVLLGDTFFERAQRYGWLETAIQLRFPKENLQLRNLGWSGDTVFAESRGIFDPPAKGYARMLDQIRGLKPTVIMLNYGGNEAFQGPDYLDTFIKQYRRLLDDLSSTQARMVLVSPLPLLHAGAPLPKPDEHNQVRRQFVMAIQKLAQERSLHYVDLWTPIEQQLATFSSRRITEEGVHLTDFGYGIVSTVFVRALTGESPYVPPDITLGPETATAQAPVQQTNYSVQDNSRTFQADIDSDTNVSGVRLSVNGLPPGTYELKSNGFRRGTLTNRELEQSALSKFGSVAMLDVEELRQAIVEKNEMYFHRWRPQNVTYLFLFRKHEQGNNAKEVDEFLPIISRLEKRIFELKQPRRSIRLDIVWKSDTGN